MPVSIDTPRYSHMEKCHHCGCYHYGRSWINKDHAIRASMRLVDECAKKKQLRERGNA